MGGATSAVGLGLQTVGLFGGGGSTQQISGMDPEASLELSQERFEFEKELYGRKEELQIEMLGDANQFANQTFAQEMQVIHAQRDEANRQLYRNFQQLQNNLDLDLARINAAGIQSQFGGQIEDQFNMANASVNAFNELIQAESDAQIQAFDADTRRQLVDELVSMRDFELENAQSIETSRLLTGQAGERSQLEMGRASQVEQFLDSLATNEEERSAVRAMFAAQGQDRTMTASGTQAEQQAMDKILEKYNFARQQYGVQSGNLLTQQGLDQASLEGSQASQGMNLAFQNYSDVYNAENQYQQQLMGIQRNVEGRTAAALQNLQGALLKGEQSRQQRYLTETDLQREAINQMLAKNVGYYDYATGLRDVGIQFSRNLLAAQSANLAGRAGNTQEAIASSAQSRANTLASMSNIIGSGGGRPMGGGGGGFNWGGLSGVVQGAADMFSQPSFNTPQSQVYSPMELFGGQTSNYQQAFNSSTGGMGSLFQGGYTSTPSSAQFNFQPVSSYSSFPTSGGNYSIDNSVQFGGY